MGTRSTPDKRMHFFQSSLTHSISNVIKIKYNLNLEVYSEHYELNIMMTIHSPIIRLETGINLDATCNLQEDFESSVFNVLPIFYNRVHVSHLSHMVKPINTKHNF